MEEFLKNNYSLLTKSFILVAVVAGIISYKKYKGTTATLFIKIIFFIFFIEVIGSYSNYYKYFDFMESIYNSVFRKTYWWYTLSFDLGITLLISIFFQKILKHPSNRKILKIITGAFIILFISYVIYNKDVFFFQTFPVIQIAGAVVIICCSILYFTELLQSDLILNFYKSIYFYVAAAIFIWWIITTPLSFYDLYFRHADWNFIILKWQIYLFANFFMYVTFAVGLLVCKPEEK